jgi:hypothetical protein
MNKVLIDLDLLKYILDQEVKKIVGKCMKRFELSNNKDDIKLQVKELIYEHMRDIKDTITNTCKGEESIILINKEDQSKE